MAGMKRFVTYIYSYEDRKKGSNVGFARFEIRGEDCKVEIHMRGIYNGRPGCHVYLFRENAGDIEGIMIGEIKIVNGSGDFGAVIKAEKIGESPFGIYDMEGLFLLGEDDRIFMSRWKEGAPIEVCKERFRIWTPKQVEEQRKVQQTVPQNTAPQRSKEIRRTIQGALSRQMNQSTPMNQNNQTTPNNQTTLNNQTNPNNQTNLNNQTNQNNQTDQNVPLEKPIETPKGNTEKIQEKAENITATEIPMRNIFPTYNWSNIWVNLQKGHPVYAPFEDKNIACVRIELKDLRELPKRYWYLGNNSFLLHGFFNYRYLVIGRMEADRWFIGIPGIYQHQERVMAAIFGFSEFIPTAVNKGNSPAAETDTANETDVANETNTADGADTAGKEKINAEEEPINRFGFWYRMIEE